MTDMTCWIVTEGSIGMENQCRGLAEALGLDPVIKRVNPRLPWLVLPGNRWPFPFLSLGPGSDRLEPPWPDILISCGRKGVPYALAVKRASGGRTFIVHIQDPLVPASAFDLVTVPSHDRIRGSNVLVTRGAIHPVTQAKLAAAAERFRPLFAHLPRPLIVVLVGGPNGRYEMEPADMARIAQQLAALARETGGGLCITTSRRTGKENEKALREGLAGVPSFIWTGEGENPYLGMLALADYVLVTADSVSMVTEGCATGKPVYIIELAGGSRRFRHFHEEMRAAGMTRPFAGRLERWSYEPAFDAERVAAEVRRLLGRRAAPKIAAAGE